MSNTSPAVLSISTGSASASNTGSSNGNLVVILSSVLSVAGIIVVTGLVFICCRYRQKRGGSFLPRGISPIDDDEIETWKGQRPPPEMCETEKGMIPDTSTENDNHDGLDSPPLLSAVTLGAGASIQQREEPPPTKHNSRARGVSLDGSSVAVGGSVLPLRRTSSNVIIYKEPPQLYSGVPNSASSTTGLPLFTGGGSPTAATPAGAAAMSYLQQQKQSTPLFRRSEEFSPSSTRSMSFGYPSARGMAGRFSFDQDRDSIFSSTPILPLTQPALQHARAPNSRAGLTDETIPGDPSFLPTPKRQQSRLVKMSPGTGSPSTTAAAIVAGASTVGFGPVFTPRRNSHSAGGSGSLPNLMTSPSSNSNISAYWHARTRSARSSSTVSGRSLGYAASDMALNQSYNAITSHQRHSCQVQNQHFGRTHQPLTPPQQSLNCTSDSLPILHKNLPVPPPPVSMRVGITGSNNGSALDEKASSNNTGVANRHSSRSLYHNYLYQEQQPRITAMSPMSSATSAGEAAMTSDDSDGPLLGSAVRRQQIQDSSRAVQEHSSNLEHMQSIGRAVG